MLDKKVSYDHTITEDGIIQVREITRIFEDGKELSKSYHRTTVNPTDDVKDKDVRTKLIAGAIYTPEFVTAYEVKIAVVEPIKSDTEKVITVK